MDTVSTLRKALIDSDKLQEEYDREKVGEHKRKVAEFIGHDTILARDVQAHNTLEEIRTLEMSGFRYFVNEEIFKKFKYTAGIRGSYIKQSHRWGNFLAGLGITVGFFSFILGFYYPEAFLGLYGVLLVPGMLFSRSGIIDFVGDVPDFVLDNIAKVSPFVNHFTVHSNSPLPVKRTQLFQSVDPVMIAWLPNGIGVVVGVWDNDKELEI